MLGFLFLVLLFLVSLGRDARWVLYSRVCHTIRVVMKRFAVDFFDNNDVVKM